MVESGANRFKPFFFTGFKPMAEPGPFIQSNQFEHFWPDFIQRLNQGPTIDPWSILHSNQLNQGPVCPDSPFSTRIGSTRRVDSTRFVDSRTEKDTETYRSSLYLRSWWERASENCAKASSWECSAVCPAPIRSQPAASPVEPSNRSPCRRPLI